MKVYISATLRSFFGRNNIIEVSNNNIEGILEFLTDEYPESKKILFDDENRLRNFVQIFVGEDNKTNTKYWKDEISENSEVLLLPAVAGGAARESIISDDRRKAVFFDDAEVERFGRHLLLKDIGVKGQKRIKPQE